MEYTDALLFTQANASRSDSALIFIVILSAFFKNYTITVRCEVLVLSVRKKRVASIIIAHAKQKRRLFVATNSLLLK
jgi:hypothetical protein